MAKININKILNVLMESILLGIIFIVPLYFAIFFDTADPFELNKLIIFRLLILVLLLFATIKIILADDIYNIKIKKLVFSKYFLVISLFFISLLLSTIFSINFNFSLAGVYKRYQGLDSYVYYLIFFILVLFYLKSDTNKFKERIRRLILALVSASFLVSLYGVAQKFGFDFVNWSDPAIITGRATSTLGQPNFLASYLLLIIPLSLYLIFKSKKLLLRFSFIIVLLFNLLCLFFTGSRGGGLGILGALLLALILYFYYCKKKIAKKIFENKILIISSFLVIIFIIFFIFKLDDSFTTRIKNGFDLKSGSVAARIYFWQAGWDAFKKRPFLGYGPETQGEVLVRYYQKDWAIYGAVNDYPDRAHNFILDILLTTGILGLITFLSLLYIFFSQALKIFKSNSEYSSLTFFLLIAISGYLISLLFSFSIVITNIYFWLYLAIILALPVGEIKPEETNAIKYTENKKIKILKLALAIIVICLAIFGIKREFNLFISDYYFNAVKEARQENDFIGAWKIYSFMEDKTFRPNYYEYYFALTLSGWDEVMESSLFNILPVKKLEEILSKIKNNNYSDEYLRAKILARLAEIDTKYINQADGSFQRLIVLSPQMPNSYHEYGDFLFKIGRVDEATEYYLKVLELFPDLNSQYINFEHESIIRSERSQIYRSLGDLYFNKNLFAKAENYYQLALRDDFDSISFFKKIADTYYKRGDFNKAIWYNKHGMVRNPRDYTWPYVIAMLYQEKGDKKEAWEYADIALQLAPGDKELLEFIKKLK